MVLTLAPNGPIWLRSSHSVCTHLAQHHRTQSVSENALQPEFAGFARFRATQAAPRTRDGRAYVQPAAS